MTFLQRQTARMRRSPLLWTFIGVAATWAVLLLPPLALSPFYSIANPMSSLPRNQTLKAFDPHRPDFTCVYEADKVPPIDPQAQAWFEEALYVTRFELGRDRDYVRAMQLYEQAVQRKHWKAMINLASIYINGGGMRLNPDGSTDTSNSKSVEWDSERGVQLLEEAMKQGIPSAFDLMGTLHDRGRGVSQDTSRAYAFWQLAADMGSASAQGYLGNKLSGGYDDPPTQWSNKRVAIPMMACAVAQGHAESAYEFGTYLHAVEENQALALETLHAGVKFGSDKCAGYLSASGKDLGIFPTVDLERARRYGTLALALRRNPDLRFPNLDKVLPLPPTQLPPWSGVDDDLINAAKAVTPAPAQPAPHPGTQLKGRAHVPAGHTLLAPSHQHRGYLGQAAVAGYWQPQVNPHDVAPGNNGWHQTQAAQAINAMPPTYMDQGENFESFKVIHHSGPDAPRNTLWHSVTRQQIEGMVWNYFGHAVPIQPVPSHPRVRRGLMREVPALAQYRTCSGAERCPQSGMWAARPQPGHAQQHEWWQQAWVQGGAAMPEPKTLGLSADARDITWVLLEPDQKVQA